MIFSKLIKAMGPVSNQNMSHSRRLHERRISDTCIITIGDRQYPVKDWSKGGVCIEADSRTFGVGDPANFTLKFRVDDQVIDVSHKASVLRKTKGSVILEFQPLTNSVEEKFETVLAQAA